MTFQIFHLHHCRVLPKAEMVLSVPVGRENFLLLWIPLQPADLRPRVYGVQKRSGPSIPEFDAFTTGTSTSSEQIAFVRRPGQCLYSGLVIRELEARSRGGRSGRVPQADHVVVGATCEGRTIGRPRESTNFLSMVGKCCYFVFGDADIVIHDKVIASTAGKNVTVPRHGTDATRMTVHVTDLFLGLDVPDQCLALSVKIRREETI